jgi:tetratricopeptide (TPR) repeat protein
MLLCLLLIAACLVLTKSRSGYVASCVGLAFVGLWRREQRIRIGWKLPVAALGVAALLVAAAMAIEGPDLLGKAWKSFGFRVQYWQSSLQMIADRPLMGCGPGNFQSAYTQYKLPQAAEEVADPHDFLLEIAATAGLPAAVAFLAVLGCFAWATSRRSAIADPSDPSPDGWRHVLAGGAAGFLLSVPVGRLGAAPPGAVAVLMGLPLAAATVGLLWGWIQNGRLQRLLTAVGVAVLLIDLLATGGIGFPAVAGTLWLLLALGLQGESPRTFHPAGAWAALFVALVLVVACYGTAYSPVLDCQGQLRISQREPARAVEHLEAAATADPLAAEPWRQLAGLAFENWWRQPGEDAFRRFEHAVTKTLELVPNSAPARLAVGDWYLRASSKTDQAGAKSAGKALEKAVAAYRQAVELYPNNPVYRAKLAEACKAAGDPAAFRVEAAAALRLDEATPHTDKKLPAAMRDRLSHDLQRAR